MNAAIINVGLMKEKPILNSKRNGSSLRLRYGCCNGGAPRRPCRRPLALPDFNYFLTDLYEAVDAAIDLKTLMAQ